MGEKRTHVSSVSQPDAPGVSLVQPRKYVLVAPGESGCGTRAADSAIAEPWASLLHFVCGAPVPEYECATRPSSRGIVMNPDGTLLLATTDELHEFVFSGGEIEHDETDLAALVREVEFDALFTFIVSPRPGTPAAEMDDPVPRSEKQVWFDRLCDTQNEISARLHAAYVGRTVRVLVDGTTDDSRWPLSARTNGGRLVHLAGDPSVIGTYQNVTVTDSNTWALFGELST